MSKEKLKDEDVEIKVSICKHCTGWVRASVKHLMTPKMEREFAKECFDNDLEVKTIPLLQFQKEDKPMCSC